MDRARAPRAYRMRLIGALSPDDSRLFLSFLSSFAFSLSLFFSFFLSFFSFCVESAVSLVLPVLCAVYARTLDMTTLALSELEGGRIR